MQRCSISGASDHSVSVGDDIITRGFRFPSPDAPFCVALASARSNSRARVTSSRRMLQMTARRVNRLLVSMQSVCFGLIWDSLDAAATRLVSHWAASVDAPSVPGIRHAASYHLVGMPRENQIRTQVAVVAVVEAATRSRATVQPCNR